ncbi:MFS transporter [Nocardioides sp. NPDC127514]|uniref:MFS transporter n=1 Tax=unclassified Nocardioides TaxID=2615069 RepID=UPI0033273ABD
MAIVQDATSRRRHRRSIIAVSAGNVLEWYDFAVYASVASILGSLFFPSSNSLTSLLASFSTFAVGYVARPVGAAVFGRLADRSGRKITLILMIAMMGVATVLIGFMPTYASVGIAAPILLVVARFVQGLSVGGEFSTATSYFVEVAPPGKRGLYGSLTYLTANLGFALGLALVYTLTNILPAGAMADWGWRVPFLLSFPLLLVGMYLRSKASETPAFVVARKEGTVDDSSMAAMVRAQWRGMVRLLGIGLVFSISSYIALAFVLSYLLVVQAQPPAEVYPAVLTALVLGAMGVPVAGHWSDRWGRRPLLITGCVLVIALAFPAFALMSSGGFVNVLLGQLLLWIPISIFSGVIPSAFSELFPTQVRSTAVGLPYAIATAVFSGTTPLVATALIGATGFSVAPAAYLVLAALISVVFVWTMRESSRDALR